MGRRLYREYDENDNLVKLECCKCGEIKTVDNFNKNKSKKDGVYNICKECRKEYNKNNREKEYERQHKDSKSRGETKSPYKQPGKSHTEYKHSAQRPNNCFCKIDNRNCVSSRYPTYNKFKYQKPCYREACSIS